MKRVLSLVLALVLVLGMIPTFAADMTAGQHLFEHEFIAGDGMGNLNEDQLLTREQLAKLILELNGSKEEAEALTLPPSFTDSAKISAWARPYVAYAQIEGLMVGFTDGSFRPQEGVTGQQLAAVLTRALGYEFSWATVIADAADLGIDVANVAKLTRGQAFEAMWVTVNTKPEGEATLTLGQKLGKLELPPAPVALAVESVTATNLKEIVVKFTTEVDKTTAETAGNYVLTSTTAAMGTPTLQADKMTVVINLATAATNQEAVKVKVQNVKDLAGKAITTVTKDLTFFDTAIPVALSYAFTGPQTIEVTYSEPLTVAGTAVVDNGIYGASAALHATNKNVVVVTLGTTLPEGAHTLKMAGAQDHVPYTALDKVFDVTYVKDVTPVTASIKSAAQTKVVVEFNKEVKGDALTTSRFYQTYTAYVPSSVTDVDGNAINVNNYYKSVIVNFATSPLPAGSVNFVILKAVGSVNVTDRYGNILAADTTLVATVTADTTAPTITKVEATNESTVKVTFSEDVTGAGTKANYVFKKADGTVIAASAYGTPSYVGGTTLTATITFSPALAGGSYSVEISNVKDSSLNANALAANTNTFLVTDKTAISTITGISIENAGTTADIIYLTYPELMSVTGDNSVLNLSNYKMGASAGAAVALPTGTTIEVFGTNNQVKITMPGTGGADITNLYVRNVADAAGNVTTALYIQPTITPDAAPVITAAKSTALNTFVFTVDKHLSAVSASSITVNGNPVAQATFVNNSNGTSTITAITQSGDALANGGALISSKTVAIVGTGIKSITGTAMAADADICAGGGVAVTPTDAVAPVASSYQLVGDYQITITFDENLLGASIAGVGKNGFSVSGGTLTSAVAGAANTIVLTGTGFTADTDVTYTPGNITDANGNALAAIAKTTALTADTTLPTVVTGVSTKMLTATTFQITFSEKVTAVAGDFTAYAYDADAAGAGAPVSIAVVSISGSGTNVITVTTAANAGFATGVGTATVNIGAGVKDLAGNAITPVVAQAIATN